MLENEKELNDSVNDEIFKFSSEALSVLYRQDSFLIKFFDIIKGGVDASKIVDDIEKLRLKARGKE